MPAAAMIAPGEHNRPRLPVVAGAVEQIAGLARQVLVDLEPHAAPRWPVSTMRSRASSAA
jgi:hypothetical protein